MDSFVLSNANVVLADRVLDRGWVAVSAGRIAEIGEDTPPERGRDLGGSLLLPGLIELHTDHLEAHFLPRPKVTWNALAAVVAYDAQLAACGITTVLDSLRVWREESLGGDADGHAELLADTIAQARDADMLRAHHFLHLRCEVPTGSVVEDAALLMPRPDVRLVSLMDHSPGQRQFRDEDKLRTYYRGKAGGMTDAELDRLFAHRKAQSERYALVNRERLVALAQAHGVTLASHDDTTAEHVAEAARDGVAIAEFPTTVEAAAALHQAGVKVMMGAPNVVRGGSHSGNVAAVDLAAQGVLDILSSDYVPSSLLMAALQLPEAVPGIDLAAAVRTVTGTPAEAVGLDDRGEIAPGKRADLVQVDVRLGVPVVRKVWRDGRRVL
ncbi:alpha-D-ribose 1-methylphosphonate 5-triphosphate diphosphatase [Blastochloris sulfoviridis]|uniref:Alpha-D-ribose 1-methylphosphonate 5-triphosphate diphosphatase n=1 Tax=Blastochloris sulfoviridis TaxID=50712 RepID=A0A5M6I6T5_9HYPH|nr:alpha-D-ribose 1-methylphosphonate 5-triphosphate diphosphatase [Blastochloris sulfoviridis]KAA5603585.1 alpha-D-ribose 1-methylphosphonate 5-triphosphate diphosphatase [Blastochloris sulfoviridis]